MPYVECFAYDEWLCSEAMMLPLGARGLLRELMTQDAGRGLRWKPSSEEEMRRIANASREEWDLWWPLVVSLWKRRREFCCCVAWKSDHARRKAIPLDTRRYVMDRDGGTCQECGSTENLHIDHIYPYSRGGSNQASNLQVLCRTCNLRKAAKV